MENFFFTKNFIDSIGEDSLLNLRITSYNVCYTKLLCALRAAWPRRHRAPVGGAGSPPCRHGEARARRSSTRPPDRSERPRRSRFRRARDAFSINPSEINQLKEKYPDLLELAHLNHSGHVLESSSDGQGVLDRPDAIVRSEWFLRASYNFV